MVIFLDGPAKGKSLALRRAPVFLRAVIDQDGTVDALDLLEDEPKPTETVHVYRRVAGTVSSAIVCSRGRGCRSMAGADYRLHDPQPPDASARHNGLWAEWAKTEYERVTKGTLDDAANQAFEHGHEN